MNNTKAKQVAELIGDKSVSNAENWGGRKELVHHLALVAEDAGRLSVVVDARWYMGRHADGAGNVLCSVWISGKSTWRSGGGKATGYGYCKQSAAFADAMESASISLTVDVAGVGMGAVRDAMSAIADALGFTGIWVII